MSDPINTTTFSNWDFHASYVDGSTQQGQFISGESTLVAAGPSRLAVAAGAASAPTGVYPIGYLENVAVQQSKQIQRVFEIGSSRSYFVPGRVVGSFSIGRMFYHGHSLMRVLYAGYKSTGAGADVNAGNAPGTVIEQGLAGQKVDPNAALLDNVDPSSLHQVKVAPGADYFFCNLASDLFNQPFGLCMYFKDQNADSHAAMYLEACYVQGHQISVSSGAILIMEGVSAQFDRVVPISVATLGGQTFSGAA